MSQLQQQAGEGIPPPSPSSLFSPSTDRMTPTYLGKGHLLFLCLPIQTRTSSESTLQVNPEMRCTQYLGPDQLTHMINHHGIQGSLPLPHASRCLSVYLTPFGVSLYQEIRNLFPGEIELRYLGIRATRHSGRLGCKKVKEKIMIKVEHCNWNDRSLGCFPNFVLKNKESHMTPDILLLKSLNGPK